MQSQAKTVKAYIAELPADRQNIIQEVRAALLKYLPEGYEETMQYGMITYVVPLARYPKGYLDKAEQPLPFLALASQKDYLSVYLMCVYAGSDDAFKKAYQATGKKLNMGKSCIRFKKVEDLALDVIGKEISKVSVDKFITVYEQGRKK